jgi:hypothetical protein
MCDRSATHAQQLPSATAAADPPELPPADRGGSSGPGAEGLCTGEEKGGRWDVNELEGVSYGLHQHSPHAELVHLGLTDDVSAGVEQRRHAGGIEGRMVVGRC